MSDDFYNRDRGLSSGDISIPQPTGKKVNTDKPSNGNIIKFALAFPPLGIVTHG